MTPAIRTESLIHDYPGGVRALAGVDLVIEPGSRVAVVGQNGSGKSTFALHLNGLLQPTSGRVSLDGRDLAGKRVSMIAASVGLLFQDPDLQIFEEAVADEVAVGPRNLGRDRVEIARAVSDALARTGLTDLAEANPFTLGFARRKLVALASVLAMATPIVVLDEPTTGQDPRGVALIADVVANLAEVGRTVVAITHDMHFAAENFDRVVVMRAGRIVLDGAPVAVFAPDRWSSLTSAHVEPPPAARVGAALGVGSTPRDDDLVRRLLAD